MAIDKINAEFAPIQGIGGSNPINRTKPTAAPDGFADMLGDALKELDSLQTEADKQVTGVTLKEPGYTPHGAMVALEKADIAFQLMSAVRGKIIRAYEEVMRTQV
jgi:flagellar hook-basal body complex protein FliE